MMTDEFEDAIDPTAWLRSPPQQAMGNSRAARRVPKLMARVVVGAS